MWFIIEAGRMPARLEAATVAESRSALAEELEEEEEEEEEELPIPLVPPNIATMLLTIVWFWW